MSKTSMHDVIGSIYRSAVAHLTAGSQARNFLEEAGPIIVGALFDLNRIAEATAPKTFKVEPATGGEASPAELLSRVEEPAFTVEYMVDRFLNWKLPEDFKPDGGVSFTGYPAMPHGTNLFTATQATAMVEHMLGWKKPLKKPLTPNEAQMQHDDEAYEREQTENAAVQSTLNASWAGKQSKVPHERNIAAAARLYTAGVSAAQNYKRALQMIATMAPTNDEDIADFARVSLDAIEHLEALKRDRRVLTEWETGWNEALKMVAGAIKNNTVKVHPTGD